MPPLEGELQRVGEQVEDDLLPHVPVDVHRLAQRRAVDGERQARAVDGGAEHAGQLRGGRGEVDRLEPRVDAAGLQPGEVEQRVDQLAQAQRVAVDDLELLAHPRLGGQLRVEARSSATGPMISVSGVRNSWLTLLKKSVFARSSSASASARRRSAS